MSLRVDRLSLAAARRPLVQDLGFEARAGERWCVIGRNAAGKSTLLRALAGLGVPARSGQVAWQPGSRTAYLPQTPADRFALQVSEWLQLHVRGQAAGDAAVARQLITDTAQALDIAPLLGRPVTQLSGGERQRVGLAGVAVQDAGLWLLDEPVSFQDPAHQGLVARWLGARQHECVVFSAHDMAWVQQVATHVIALSAGGQWHAGPVHAVLDAALLEQVYGCPWRQIAGVWMAGESAPG